MGRRRLAVRGWLTAAIGVAALTVAAAAAGGGGLIKSPDLRDWLTYLASDELEGRAVFTTGFGLAVAYVEDHLRTWGVKPAGDHGSYLQTVRVLGVKTTSHSTVSVTVNGETRTFTDGEGITFPRNMGGKRRFTVDRVEFAGYGIDAPGRVGLPGQLGPPRQGGREGQEGDAELLCRPPTSRPCSVSTRRRRQT